MTSRVMKTVIAWTAVIIWMGIIFMMSSENAAASTHTSGSVVRIAAGVFVDNFDSMTASEQNKIVREWQNVVRKAAHYCEYTVLGAMLSVAFYSCGFGLKKRFVSAFVAGTAYAASDEIHQMFVPGRAAMLKDVLLDSSGVITGALFVLLAALLIRTIRKNRQSLNI